MRRNPALLACLAVAALALTAPGVAKQVRLGSGSVVQTILDLRPGDYVWEPRLAPHGPYLLVVNTRTQRGLLFRNGVPMAATTLSTGRKGLETPTGVFTILQKRVEHYSSKYDNAPMPYMQRLTWSGVALHAGHLPGYPASHGCIRLPLEFARKLYGVTRVGMTVLVTDQPATPRLAPSASDLFGPDRAIDVAADKIEWSPQRAPSGPVSILVSAADRRATILRNGMIIGSGPVSVTGASDGTTVYMLQEDNGGRSWLRLNLSAEGATSAIGSSEWARFVAPPAFRQLVATIIGPGTTIIVTADSLRPAAPLAKVLESDDQPERP